MNSSRLFLRPFRHSDITDSYIGWLNDPFVTQFSNQRFVRHSISTSKEFLESFQDSDNTFLLIIRTSDNLPIGTMTIYRNLHHGLADIGIMIGESGCWGSGFGYEAWQIVINSLLLEPGIRKITAGAASVNSSMLRIFIKSGMKLESVRISQEIIQDTPVDLHYYSLFT